MLQWEHHWEQIPGLAGGGGELCAGNVDSRAGCMEREAALKSPEQREQEKKCLLHEKANRLSLEKATRRNTNLHSVAQDVTTPAPLESPFLKILESTSYPIKNITKKSQLPSLCVLHFRHTNFFYL